jgi:capsular exopolysaccharide synthesis family protein
MSLIFDALQRSEADRSGVDLSALSAATEVLQLAELRAASERKASNQFNDAAAQTSKLEMSLPLPALSPAVIGIETPGQAEPSLNDKHLDVFAQFRSLQISVATQSRLLCLTDNESPVAEEFRFMGVRLQQLRRERPLRKVLITSTIPQEGKSMVSANLACTLGRRPQQRTLLVEGDVRRPALSQMFGLGQIPGISECLQEQRTLMQSVYYLGRLGLWFLPAGNAPTNPLELLQSGRLPVMFNELTAWFDWIFIDSPPVIPLADTSVWTRLADGILLVVRQGITEKKRLERGLEVLDQNKVIGALLNGCKRPARSDYYYTRVTP